MADIYIRRRHDLDMEAAHELLDEVADELAETLQIEYHKQGDTLRFRRAGAHGSIVLTDTEIIIEATLGLMLLMMKPTLEHAIHDTLDRYL